MQYQCGADAVPARCRRGADAVPEFSLGYCGGTRGYRGLLGPRLGLWCGCVRVQSARAMSVCVCACAHLRVCVHLCACARVHACMRACVSACAWVRSFRSDCIFARVCVASVCVCSERVRASRRCARPPIARRRLVILIARPVPRFAAARAWLRSVPTAGLARVGRRCHLDEPHGQRGMGCAKKAHVRGRRRRRHLRHRRLHRLQLLPRRVGQHRRRCTAGLSPGGGRGGTRRGTQEYSMGAWGY